MKLRILTVVLAVGVLGAVGCGDDITNIIEEVQPTNTPDSGTPSTPTNTPDTGPPTPTPTMRDTECRQPMEGEEIICGDGVCLAPEECDIGGICVGGSNDLAPCTSPDDCDGGRCTVVGGQPVDPSDPEGPSCSANCTIETRRTAPYDEDTGALVQALSLGVPVPLDGSQTIQTGAPRDEDTIDINGDVTFRAGDLPMITKAEDIRIEPAQVLGLVCACVRGVEVPAFGAGNAATGLISCGGGLEDIDVLITQDHHTDPIDETFMPNPSCALPPDPECDDDLEIVPGVISPTCREQVDPECNDPATNRHPGVCNSARVVEFSGMGPVGSAIIFNTTAIGLLSDRGECRDDLAGMDPCPFEDYGPDCIPCTDDDLDLGVTETNPTTTGTTRSRVFNASNRPGAIIDQSSNAPCTESADCTELNQCGEPETCIRVDGEMRCGNLCGGSGPCQTTTSGSPFDCEALMSNQNGGLEGGAFAVTFPSIDAATIGDNVTSVLFSF